MADGYWNRQQPPTPLIPPSGALKRSRTEYDVPPSAMPSGREMHDYLSSNEERGVPLSVKDTKTIGSAYDRYLQNVQMSSVPSGEASPFGGVGLGRPGVRAMPGLPTADRMMDLGGIAGPDLAHKGHPTGFGGQPPLDAIGRPKREPLPLPPDASNTLYVEGLPSDCKKREVAHIFRPFVGYKEVRLVTKEPKHRGGDPLILCFVDFINPACAATALSALQGYQMDEDNPDSKLLRLQFSRHPGPRSGPGTRGKR